MRGWNVEKMAKYLFVILLMSSVLACGLPATLPATAVTAPELSLAPTPPAQVVEMVVTASRLNIRADANYTSAADPQGLERGQVIKVYLTCTGGEMRDWVALDRDCTRWVNVDYLGNYP